MKINYYKKMLEEIEEIQKQNIKPKLLLHSCCAPCSSYVLQALAEFFEIEVLYFNPNIYPEDEYGRRLEEQKRLIADMGLKFHVIGLPYDSHLFYEAVRGLENMGEGTQRCFNCYKLRLERTAQYARENHFDYFTTTLTISPMKNAAKLNELGEQLQAQYGVKFLNSDFKKNEGYKKSTELSKQYNLYRQDYCGCVFSLTEAKKRREAVKSQVECVDKVE